MGKGDKPDTLLVMPIRGKYCELFYNGRYYKIWKVHPGTPDKFGTLVPYEVALYYLCKVPTVISEVTSIKDGKLISGLTDEDMERVRESRASGFSAVKNYNKYIGSIGFDDSGNTDKALTDALKLVSDQAAENKKLLEQQAALVARLDTLEKAVRVGTVD
jgi:hypothetical protein